MADDAGKRAVGYLDLISELVHRCCTEVPALRMENTGAEPCNYSAYTLKGLRSQIRLPGLYPIGFIGAIAHPYSPNRGVSTPHDFHVVY